MILTARMTFIKVSKTVRKSSVKTFRLRRRLSFANTKCEVIARINPIRRNGDFPKLKRN